MSYREKLLRTLLDKHPHTSTIIHHHCLQVQEFPMASWRTFSTQPITLGKTNDLPEGQATWVHEAHHSEEQAEITVGQNSLNALIPPWNGSRWQLSTHLWNPSGSYRGSGATRAGSAPPNPAADSTPGNGPYLTERALKLTDTVPALPMSTTPL